MAAQRAHGENVQVGSSCFERVLRWELTRAPIASRSGREFRLSQTCSGTACTLTAHNTAIQSHCGSDAAAPLAASADDPAATDDTTTIGGSTVGAAN
jgi:hypothetical protein